MGVVALGLVEGEGEMLDAVFGAELHEEVGELSQLGCEPFYIVGRSDTAEQHDVVGEIIEAVRVREDGERGRECRVFREG